MVAPTWATSPMDLSGHAARARGARTEELGAVGRVEPGGSTVTGDRGDGAGAAEYRGSTETGAEVEGSAAPDGATPLVLGAADGTAALGVAARMDGVGEPEGSTVADGGTGGTELGGG